MKEPLLILAADHRASLERDLYGLSAPPTAAQAARISADKLLIYQALVDALPDIPNTAQPGILIDEQYGASVAELAARTSGAICLAMPVEASGEQWLRFAYGEAWQAHGQFFGADHAKILVRDNPGSDREMRAAQAERVSQVSAWAAAGNHALIIELLVPATPADLDNVSGDGARYDRELRPGHTLAVIQYLQDKGVEPAIWKVEGFERQEDAVAVVAVVKRDGRTASCIVLGRHASHDQLDHWLQVAAPITGYNGFAIGRSIWWDALNARLHQRATTAETRHRISAAYTDFVTYYLAAREGAVGVGSGASVTNSAASNPAAQTEIETIVEE